MMVEAELGRQRQQRRLERDGVRRIDALHITQDPRDRVLRVLHVESGETHLGPMRRVEVVRAHPAQKLEQLARVGDPEALARERRRRIADAAQHVVVDRQRLGIAGFDRQHAEAGLLDEQAEQLRLGRGELVRAVRCLAEADDVRVAHDLTTASASADEDAAPSDASGTACAASHWTTSRGAAGSICIQRHVDDACFCGSTETSSEASVAVLTRTV